jgi:hypothetical protein
MTKLARRIEPNEWSVASARKERLLQALANGGFRPAFFDFATGALYPSLARDGTPSSRHDPSGLPDSVVVIRTDKGRILATRSTLRIGYERGGYFFTRSAARRALREWAVSA